MLYRLNCSVQYATCRKLYKVVFHFTQDLFLLRRGCASDFASCSSSAQRVLPCHLQANEQGHRACASFFFSLVGRGHLHLLAKRSIKVRLCIASFNRYVV